MTNPQAPAGSTEWPPAATKMIGAWMSRQRWYANRGAVPLLEEIGSWSLAADQEADRTSVDIVTHLYLDHSPGKPALYQVPITRRSLPLPGGAGALIGELDGLYCYDGPHDPAYTAALLALVTRQREVTGNNMWVLGSRAATVTVPPNTEPPALVPQTTYASRVLTGEQSNTSIIYEPSDSAPAPAPAPAILKLFRAIHDGDNPDVELQSALAAAGSTAVPHPVGSVLAEWDDRGLASGRARGHLAFAQDFLAGAEDGWRVAIAAAELGVDFSAQARALGVATAGAHATLAATLPTRPAAPGDIEAGVRGMLGRLAAAIAEVPLLTGHAAAIEAKIAAAASATWPEQQRIHGDLHLGQALAVPQRGWMLVDFEGEPLRPMRERSRLDSPLRDLAGMLRSFDYVAGSITIAGHDPAAARQWAARARAAFERGYSDASGRDLRQSRALVDAFEIDKALYETVYEARNRPSWLRIPVEAIERLAARDPVA